MKAENEAGTVLSSGEQYERNTEALSRTLPEDVSLMKQTALDALQAYDRAILAGDLGMAEAMTQLYDAVVFKMNGNSWFGCQDKSDPEAGGIVVGSHCAALPGTVPLWGQFGEFLIVVDGIRAVVRTDPGLGGGLWPHFSFHVVDRRGLFISQTGYRSHFCQPSYGQSVEDFATAEFRTLLQAQRRPLDKEYRDREADEAWPWLDVQAPPPVAVMAYEATGGQMAFGF